MTEAVPTGTASQVPVPATAEDDRSTPPVAAGAGSDRTAGRGPGRRPGSADTRGVILAAARAEFGARGYDGASVRGIARAAGVDPALVHHYFGTKEKVFVAAMDLPIVPADVVPTVLAGDVDGIGARVAAVFFGVWESPERRAPFLALLASSASSEQAATMLRGFITSTLLSRVAGALGGGRRAQLAVELAAAHLIGTAWLRYVVRLEPLASRPLAEVQAAVGESVQRLLDTAR